MKTVAISEFKAHALQVLRRVAKTRVPVIVTNRGKPIAEVGPFRDSNEKPTPGRLSETLVFEKDIISPIGESDWGAGNMVRSTHTRHLPGRLKSTD